MSKPIFADPIPTPSTGRSDPNALAAQINAEAEPKPVSEWIAQLLCPAMKPNHHVHGLWADPDQRTLALIKTKLGGTIVTLMQYSEEGALIATLKGHGPTVRAAYEHAHHQHRRARHSIEGLHRQRRRAIRRSLSLRARLHVVRQIADLGLATNDDLLAKNIALQNKIDQARGRIADLEKDKGLTDELNAARNALLASPAKALGVSLAEGVNNLAQLLKDREAGLSDVRRVLVQVYPEGDKLALDKRILGLAKERDIWKARANRAEAANRAEVRDAIHSAQRVADPDVAAEANIPFPLTDDPGGTNVQHV